MSTIKNLWNSILQTIGTTTTNFGGLVTAQTPTTDNSTNVATTAYVQSNIENISGILAGSNGSTVPPAMGGYAEGQYGPCFWNKNNGVLTQSFAYCTNASDMEDIITFPIPFSGVPVVMVTPATGAVVAGSLFKTVTATQFQAIYWLSDGAGGGWTSLMSGQFMFITATGPA